MRESQYMRNAHIHHLHHHLCHPRDLFHRHRTARRRRGAWRVATVTSKDTFIDRFPYVRAHATHGTAAVVDMLYVPG